MAEIAGLKESRINKFIYIKVSVLIVADWQVHKRYDKVTDPGTKWYDGRSHCLSRYLQNLLHSFTPLIPIYYFIYYHIKRSIERHLGLDFYT